MIHKRSTALERSVKICYWRALTDFTAPTSPLIQMRIETHRYLVCMKDPYLINASFPRTYKSRFKKEIKRKPFQISLDILHLNLSLPKNKTDIPFTFVTRIYLAGIARNAAYHHCLHCLLRLNNLQGQKYNLSYDVASESEITPCNKIDKPLVVYRFTGNVMTSITTLST